MIQPNTDKSGDTLYDFKSQDFLSRMEVSFQREHFLTRGLKNTGNKSINGATRGLKNPGIGTDYWMAVIYITWNSANKLASQLAPKIGKIALWWEPTVQKSKSVVHNSCNQLSIA